MLTLVVFSALVAAATASFGAPDAVVGIVPGGNKKISGTVYFSKHPYGVLISGTIKGLSPGLHGFHIHAKGDTSDGCAAAGGHYNPLQRTHGSPQDYHRHAGDLGNILANKDGVAEISLLDNHISLDHHSQTFVGNLAVVVHAGEDDLGKGGNDGSLTTGNAGGRDGCGIIHLVQRPPVPQRQAPLHRGGGGHSSDFYRPRYHY